MSTTEFEPRMGPSLWLQSPCSECECPPGRTRWLAPLCPGIIAGTVYDARTGEPLGNISIWIESFETDSFGEATTDSLGHYRIAELEAGEGYVLTASGPGYSYRLLEDGVLPEEGLVQNVALVRTGAIRGTIRDSYDMPIEGATLYLAQQDAPAFGQEEAQTNENGEFCLCSVYAASNNSLNGSNYNIWALHPDYSYIETIRSIPPYYLEGDGVVLDGVMPERATIEATVTSGGAPLGGAIVSIYDDTKGLMSGGEDTTTVTDSNGIFSLRVNAPNTYHLSVQGNQTEIVDIEINVTPGQFLSYSVEVAASGSISGIVRDASLQPISEALVEVLAQDDDEGLVVEPTFSDSEGNYAFSRVAPTSSGESYIVRVSVANGEDYTLLSELAGVTVTSNINTTADIYATF